ncbi:MAG TPA: hypothetical protein VNC50_12650 [Planctomycetia bacterium]|nr:hypothetical protein [Planctomycetia bacterium]
MRTFEFTEDKSSKFWNIALEGSIYPKLKYLGLRNSVIADEVAAAVVNSPLLSRIEPLDLSMGNMSDAGASSLLKGLAGNTTLKRLVLSFHYISEAKVKELKKGLRCTVIADDPQQEEDDWRPIMYSE